MDCFDGFSYIESCLHHWDETYLIMVDDVFDVFLDLVLSILLRSFASMFTRDTGLKFDFFVVYFCGLGIRVTVAS